MEQAINSVDTRPIYWGGFLGGSYGLDASGVGMDYLTGQGSFKPRQDQENQEDMNQEEAQ